MCQNIVFLLQDASHFLSLISLAGLLASGAVHHLVDSFGLVLPELKWNGLTELQPRSMSYKNDKKDPWWRLIACSFPFFTPKPLCRLSSSIDVLRPDESYLSAAFSLLKPEVKRKTLSIFFSIESFGSWFHSVKLQMCEWVGCVQQVWPTSKVTCKSFLLPDSTLTPPLLLWAQQPDIYLNKSLSLCPALNCWQNLIIASLLVNTRHILQPQLLDRNCVNLLSFFPRLTGFVYAPI